MADEVRPSASRRMPVTAFLYPAIGLLAVGNAVFLLLWLLSPIAGGPSHGGGGEQIQVRSGHRVLKVAEGMGGESPSLDVERRLPSEQFEELSKTLASLTQSTRSGEQAEEFFKSDAGRGAQPAVTLSFPRSGVGTETVEVYAIDDQRHLCYARLARTGQALAIRLDDYLKAASALSRLAGGAAGSFPLPRLAVLGEPLREKLAKLKQPLLVTTVSVDPRQYLVRMLSNPILGPTTLKLQALDTATVMATVQLPDDQAKVRGLAEAMARASANVKVRHLDFATDAAALKEFARSIQREPGDVEDSLVLQRGDRVRVIRNVDMLVRGSGGSTSAARFEGEGVAAQALDELLAERGLVCFAEGHGERRIGDRSGEGFSQIADQVSARGFRTAALDLAAKAIPADCQVLVIAGPRKPFGPELEKAIQDYLEAGGRLALMLDPPDGEMVLAEALKRWGVAVPEPKKVLEIKGSFSQPMVIELRLNGELDFVGKWAREAAIYFTACGLAVGAPAEGVACEALCVARPVTTEESAKSTCLLAGVRPKAGGKGPKLLVYGDADAFTNQIIRQVPNNIQLLIDSLGWLAE